MSKRKSKTTSINKWSENTAFFFLPSPCPVPTGLYILRSLKSDTQSSNGRIKAKMSQDDG